MEQVQNDNSEFLICKLGNPSSKLAEDITIKEKAEFTLTTNLQKLDEKLEEYRLKISKCTNEIKSQVNAGNRQTAILMLKRKKAYD